MSAPDCSGGCFDRDSETFNFANSPGGGARYRVYRTVKDIDKKWGHVIGKVNLQCLRGSSCILEVSGFGWDQLLPQLHQDRKSVV